MVDYEAVVFVPHGDVIKERRAAEGANGGHMCPNSAVFHYLEKQGHFIELFAHLSGSTPTKYQIIQPTQYSVTQLS